MNDVQKVPSLARRFFDTWKKEGILVALNRSLVKVEHRIQLTLMKWKLYRIRQRYYKEIYNAYVSTSLNTKDSDYVDLPSYDLSHEILPVKALAFYLPQYHPIPENDAWWGKGFTEWTNVSKAVPNFIGHYQPHLPGELGFYDLRLPQVIERQIELARKFGIFGFCFYYYWFDGKRLLDLPLDQFLRLPDNDFPFCLCWANENWTRTWDGLENQVLIAQNHSPEGDFNFIQDIQPYLNDRRYIKIHGHPAVMVYRPQILPDPAATVKRWREYCKSSGLDDLYLVAIQSGEVEDPRSMGFDAAAEFPPHGIPTIPYVNPQLKITNPDYTGMVFDYQVIAEQMTNKHVPDYRLFKTVITGWDNTARRQNQSYVFHNASPSAYQCWISSAMQYTLENAPEGERFVLINAWNEWAEGTHLEPDRKYGYAYLDATARALSPSATALKSVTATLQGVAAYKQHNTAVIFHLFYPELWEEIRQYLDNLQGDFDLFVSIPTEVGFDPQRIIDHYPNAYIYHCPNRGRDIAPFLRLFSLVERSGYEYVCKLHTKRSLHREDGELWRTEIYQELLGSPAAINDIKQKLSRDDVGLIGPKDHILSSQYFMGGNEHLITKLAKELNLDYRGEYFTFIAGSMFWFKPQAISRILNLNLSEEDFPVEAGQIDATLAHALERLIGLLAYKSKLKILQTGEWTDAPNNNYNFAVPYRQR